MQEMEIIDRDPPDGAVCDHLVVSFEPVLDAQSNELRLVRTIHRGGSAVERANLWCQRYAHRRHAEAIFAWMTKRSHQWPLWGRLSQLVGPTRLLAVASAEVARERYEEAQRLLKARSNARKSRERARKIKSYLVERRGEFGVDLRRGGHDKGFFAIWFRQSWERERFRDWWRPQAHRFAEFAAFFDEHGGQALERMLLREMQETERRVKIAGLSAGGRRPLRFWRGDE